MAPQGSLPRGSVGLTVPLTTWSLLRAEAHFAKQSLPDAQRETDEAVLGARDKSACERADVRLEGSGAELCFCRPAGSPLQDPGSWDPHIWGGPRGVAQGQQPSVHLGISATVQATHANCCLPQPFSLGQQGRPGLAEQGCSPNVGRRHRRPIRGPAGQMRGP